MISSALRQHVDGGTPRDGTVARVHDCEGLEAQRVECVAKDVDLVVVVAEREVGLPVADGQKTTLRPVCPETRRLGHGLGR